MKVKEALTSLFSDITNYHTTETVECDTYNTELLQEDALLEAIEQLNKVNKKLGVLTHEKENLIDEIIQRLQHVHEGERSYEYSIYKITCKTPMTYILDKKKYLEINLPEEYNPIKESIAYTVDKKLTEEYMEKAPMYVRQSLIELITKKPAKASVVVKYIAE